MFFLNRIISRLKIRGRASGTALIGAVLLLALVLISTACTAQGAPLVKATWVKPQTSGDTISISAADVTNNKIAHFSVPFALGTENFMAYELGGKVYVRANVCPPCRSVGFDLSGDRLICETCKTVFKAATGDGVSGACVAYPKASIAYQVEGDQIVMLSADLQSAYQNTMEPGWP